MNVIILRLSIKCRRFWIILFKFQSNQRCASIMILRLTDNTAVINLLISKHEISYSIDTSYAEEPSTNESIHERN
jgi:hypothetical protein